MFPSKRNIFSFCPSHPLQDYRCIKYYGNHIIGYTRFLTMRSVAPINFIGLG